MIIIAGDCFCGGKMVVSTDEPGQPECANVLVGGRHRRGVGADRSAALPAARVRPPSFGGTS